MGVPPGQEALLSLHNPGAGSRENQADSPVGWFPSPLGPLCTGVYSEWGNIIFTLTHVPSGFQLLDTKSTDRKQTLLHYISNVVKEKYQQVSLFYNELHYVEKAAAGTQFQLVTLLLGVNALSHGGTILPV